MRYRILTNLNEDHLGIDEVYTLEDLLHKIFSN